MSIKNATAMSEESPFLNLPPEIRNNIYTLAAKNEHHIKLSNLTSSGHTIELPPITRVCKQIHSECKALWLHTAPQFAQEVELHLYNFDTEHVESALKRLPAKAEDVKREARVIVTLDNEFDQIRYFERFGECLRGDLQRVLAKIGGCGKIHVKVHCSGEDFDAARCERMFRRCEEKAWKGAFKKGQVDLKGISFMRALRRGLSRAKKGYYKREGLGAE